MLDLKVPLERMFIVKKRLISLILAVLCALSVPCISYAQYDTTIPSTAQGNSTTLIYIKRPQSHSASTSDKTYTISAVGSTGTKVKIYREADGVGQIIKSEKEIGASGLYSTVVDLTQDINNFIVYAENGAEDQVVKIQISKVKQSTVDKLKNLTVNILNFIK
jgi:hypothetical protein